MSDSSTLRHTAREAIQAGRLPKRQPERVWAGPGSGACCAICGTSTTADEVEFELDFVRPGEALRTTTYFAHSRCFSAWKLEMRAASHSGLPTTNHDGTIGVCERPFTQEREPV
jgi:hypothetical protein